jgi:hypothetical protein
VNGFTDHSLFVISLTICLLVMVETDVLQAGKEDKSVLYPIVSLLARGKRLQLFCNGTLMGDK